MDPAAELVGSLLSVPSVTVLVTSRVPLHLREERVWNVAPLAHDGAASAAVALFAERASQVLRGFSLGEVEDVAAVERICGLVDGMPLAIELAAARCRSMSPTDILAALERDAARVLRGSRRGVDERQQNLAATIGWSYELLGPVERELFARLSVFAGTFDLAAVEAVCSGGEVDALEVVDLLHTLVDQSLVELVDRPGSSASRYRVLEPIRQYAQPLVADPDVLAAGHADHFVGLAEASYEGMHTNAEASWIDRLDADFGNHRVAYRWCAGHDDLGGALTIAIALNHLGELALQRPDGAEILLDAIELPGLEDHDLGAIALAHAAAALGRRRRREEALTVAARATGLARTPQARFESALWRASVGLFIGEREIERTWGSEALERARHVGHPRAPMMGNSMMAIGAFMAGDLDRAGSHARTAEELLAAVPPQYESSFIRSTVGMVRCLHQTAIGRPDRALDIALEDVTACRRAGNRWAVGNSLLSAIRAAVRVLEPVAQLELLAEAIPEWRRANDLSRLGWSLPYAAHALAAVGRDGIAARVLGAAGTPEPPEVPVVEALTADLEDRLGGDELTRLREEGRTTAVRDIAVEILDAIDEFHSGSVRTDVARDQ